jgi:cytosine/adenosine deaminase-related metal-dependent hydrolase
MERRDAIIVGGRVLDFDGDLDLPPVADVFIEDGRISAVGEAASQRAMNCSDVERIDATGKLVIPGLINAHYHSHDVMLRGLFEQMPLDVWGFYSFPGNYPRRSRADIYLRTVLGATECLMNGITTVQDMVTVVGDDREHVDAILGAYEDCGARVVLGLQVADRAAADCVPYWDGLSQRASSQLPGPANTVGLQKVIEELIVGGSRPRLRWALAPSAPQRCSDALLTWATDLARAHHLQIFTHLYEARSQAVLARMSYPNASLIGHMAKFGMLGPRLTIAHGVWISDQELVQFGAAGANLAFNPMSNMKLLNGFAPIRQYIAAGAGVGLGCDNCSGSDVQNLFQSMKMFALYWGLQSPAGDAGAARQALHAATIGGARAIGMEGEIGEIKPGYRADLVLIDLDAACYRPLNSAVRQLVYGETGTAVDTVIVDGKVVVRNRELVARSARALKAAAEEAKLRLQPDIDAVAARNKTFVDDLLSAYRKAERYPLDFDRYSMR